MYQPSSERSFVLGVSGQIGAGKSTLGRLLAGWGGVNLEVDEMGHHLLADPAIRSQLVEAFGSEILGPDGNIQRRMLGRRAFAGAASLALLNSIMHPPLRREARRLVAAERERGTPLVILNAALLFTIGLDELCHLSVYVTAPEDVRLQRIVQSRGLSVEAARARLLVQDVEPAPSARVLICRNDGAVEALADWVSGKLIPLLQSMGPILHRRGGE